MTPDTLPADLDRLEALAKAAVKSSSEPWYTADNLRQWMGDEDGALAAALSPATVLGLIALARRAVGGEGELTANDIAGIIDQNADADQDGLHNASQLAEKIYRALKGASHG